MFFCLTWSHRTHTYDACASYWWHAPFLDQFIPIIENDYMVFMLDKVSFSRMYFLDKLSHGVSWSIDYTQIKQARSWTMVCQEIRRFTCDDIMVAYLFVSFTESVMFDMRFDSKANNSACFFWYSVRTKYFDRRWQEFNVSIWFFSTPKLSMFVALC